MKLILLAIIQMYLLVACGINIPDSSDPTDLFAEYRQVNLQESGSFSQFLENIKEHYNVPGIAAALVQCLH